MPAACWRCWSECAPCPRRSVWPQPSPGCWSSAAHSCSSNRRAAPAQHTSCSAEALLWQGELLGACGLPLGLWHQQSVQQGSVHQGRVLCPTKAPLTWQLPRSWQRPADVQTAAMLLLDWRDIRCMPHAVQAGPTHLAAPTQLAAPADMQTAAALLTHWPDMSTRTFLLCKRLRAAAMSMLSKWPQRSQHSSREHRVGLAFAANVNACTATRTGGEDAQSRLQRNRSAPSCCARSSGQQRCPC